MRARPTLRTSLAYAVIGSIAAHAAVAVSAARHVTAEKTGFTARPAELLVDVESPVVERVEESYPVVPERAATPPSPRVEHRARPTGQAAAVAPRTIARETSAKEVSAHPMFSLVIRSGDTAPDGPTSASGTGGGAGESVLHGSGGAPATGDGADGVVPDSAVSLHAHMVSTSNPVYPPAALAQGIETSVKLEIVVDKQGVVTDARVARGAGYGFEESAVRWLRAARFTPAMRDGHAVSVRVPWVVDFRIE